MVDFYDLALQLLIASLHLEDNSLRASVLVRETLLQTRLKAIPNRLFTNFTLAMAT